ncbi:MAG: N-acetyltransferase family protein [Alphaproteobacteria bacterium]
MPQARLILRDGAPADGAAVAALFLAARRAAMPWLPALHSDAETRAWIDHVVLAKLRVRIAETDGEIAGFLARDGGHVDHLYVAPDRQRSGIGSALLAEAQAEGIPLTLHVFARNEAARRFYRGHRFVEGPVGNGTDNEERLPDLVMTWTPARP